MSLNDFSVKKTFESQTHLQVARDWRKVISYPVTHRKKLRCNRSSPSTIIIVEGRVFSTCQYKDGSSCLDANQLFYVTQWIIPAEQVTNTPAISNPLPTSDDCSTNLLSTDLFLWANFSSSQWWSSPRKKPDIPAPSFPRPSGGCLLTVAGGCCRWPDRFAVYRLSSFLPVS